MKWILLDHEATHNNVYKFPCPVEGCDKKYNSKSNLHCHLLKHDGKKPFICDDCRKTFGSKWILAKHKSVCKGEKTDDSLLGKRRRRSVNTCQNEV